MLRHLLVILSLTLSPLADSRSEGADRPVDEQQVAAGETDLLTFARGILFVGQEGLASGSSGAALLAIDGDPYRLSLTTDRNLPVTFTYKLPALTTFTRFAVPGVVEQPGNVTFVRKVTVLGSAEGPDAAFEELATLELETHGPDPEVTEVVPDVHVPVRWIRLRFEGGINIEEGDEGRTLIWFSELIGNGLQETTPLSTTFDGTWDMRLTERTDLRGTPLSLHQVGASITGCYGDYRIAGTVNGRIARATGEDDAGRTAALILVADEDGSIQASTSLGRGRFAARTAVSDPDTAEPSCGEPPSEPVACGTNVYINFDLDSATIRPESEQVLADVFQQLRSEAPQRVSIVGHTSTEGDADYNQALSERRAQAVVDDLVSRGFDPSLISAVGLGESQPLVSPDRNETARELNRRVEVGC